MAGRAVDFRGDVPHVGKVDVVRYFVDSDPGDRLLIRPVVPDLLDLRLLPFIGPADDLVATEAGRNRRDSRIDRAFRREVAVLAVDPIVTGVNRMGERNRLDRIGLAVGDRHRRTTILRLPERR